MTSQADISSVSAMFSVMYSEERGAVTLQYWANAPSSSLSLHICWWENQSLLNPQCHLISSPFSFLKNHDPQVEAIIAGKFCYIFSLSVVFFPFANQFGSPYFTPKIILSGHVKWTLVLEVTLFKSCLTFLTNCSDYCPSCGDNWPDAIPLIFLLDKNMNQKGRGNRW